jgi:predicted nucleic acid-binding protein
MAVVDCSVIIAALMPDEMAPVAMDKLATAVTNQAIAPRLLSFELINVVIMKSRRGLLGATERERVIKELSGLPITFVDLADAAMSRSAIELALRTGLSGYDAACLQLALEQNAALATLDAKLAAVATKLGITLV